MEEYICEICGKKLKNLKALCGHKAHHSKKYLNTINENKRIVEEEYHKKPKYCKQCGKKLSYKKRNLTFCDNSCSASFNNKKKKHKIFICKFCGKTRRLTSGSTGQFCNQTCQNTYNYLKYIEEWKQNLNNGSVGNGRYVSKYIKRYLFEKYENKCSECGWSEINPYTGNTPLEVEHIDGNSENNTEENLILLCPNCHSLTKTYKGANRGNGRHYRRQRYKNGESY